MLKQGYGLQWTDYRKKTLFNVFFAILFLLFTVHYLLPTHSYAQEISPSVKKSVVKNFKADLKNLLPFGTSENCEFKSRGDANCDGSINQFDLSIWEIEFNATPIKSGQAPRRSDFNNDGLINLLDFGIWRNTFYPSLKTDSNPFQNLLQPNGAFNLLSSIFNFQFSIFNVNAQENPVNTQPLESSQAIISGSGNAFVINSEGGQTQQVSFNPDGSAVSSQLFDTNGRLLANVSFLSSGQTSITTQEDGVLVQINKTEEGAVIEFFRNPDGSLIAAKVWANQNSYARSEPPLSVTLPQKDRGTFLTVNIQPNQGAVMQEFNPDGKILTQSQILSNGAYASINTNTGAITQSVPDSEYIVLNMPNNLGGATYYYFLKNILTLINVTDNKNNTWYASPNGSTDSWKLIEFKDGARTESIVADPIKELNINTPTPRDLIQNWSYYSNAANNQDPVINYSTAFNSNSRLLTNQVRQADLVYKINQVPAPNVLGIVKEVYASGTMVPDKDNPGGPGQSNFVDPVSRDWATVNVPTGTWGIGGPMDVQVNFGGSLVTISVPASAFNPDTGLNPGGTLSPAGVNSLLDSARAGTDGIAVKSGELPSSVPSFTDPPTQGPPPAPAPAPATGPAPATAPQPAPAPPPPPPPTSTAPTSSFPSLGPSSYNGYSTNTTQTGAGTYSTSITIPGVVNPTTFDQTFNITTGAFESGTWSDGSRGYSFGIGPGGIQSIVDEQGNTWSLDTSGHLATTRGDGAVNLQDQGWFSDMINERNQANGYQPGGLGYQDPTINPSCFLAGTLISTPNGLVPIETIKSGTKVYSFNEKTRQKEVSDFSKLDINFVDEYLILNDSIKTTTYHPFYIKTRQGIRLKEADKLKTGDLLIDENNNEISVESIKKIKASVTVYNLLNVTPNNNFYAGGILVHNYLDRPDPWSEEALARGDYNWDDYTAGWSNPEAVTPDTQTEAPTEPEADTPAEPEADTPAETAPDDAGDAPSSEDSPDE